MLGVCRRPQGPAAAAIAAARGWAAGVRPCAAGAAAGPTCHAAASARSFSTLNHRTISSSSVNRSQSDGMGQSISSSVATINARSAALKDEVAALQRELEELATVQAQWAKVREEEETAAIARSSLEEETERVKTKETGVVQVSGYVRDILSAKVYDVCKQTDLHLAPRLSKATGNRVLLKREDQQIVYSFKLRGAYNKIVHLTAEEKARGIVACSAGNHAQGVAYGASALGLSAKIFMPNTTPMIKVDAVKSYINEQSEVILVGNNLAEADAAAMKCMEDEGRVLVHPFNDPLVIAGQGTIAQEILAQTTQEKIDAVFVCVGGGGLAAGVGIFLKSVNPSIKVIGVEAKDAAAMTESLAAGEIVELQSVGLFADGAAVKKVGEESFRICQQVVDEMITVTTDEICGAIKDTFVDTRVVLEPAGALATAGLKQYIQNTGAKGQTFVAITSGANIDFDRLRYVAERADTSETLIAVNIPERPGAFLELYRHVYPRNVTEFSYRICGDLASIFLSFQAESPLDAEEVLNQLTVSGFEPVSLVDNELGKTHGRHLAGGRAPAKLTTEEILIRFEFPERPGSLLRFLEHLPSDFNVSLFHYRSHGADVGRVLVGLQVPQKWRGQLRQYLDYLSSQGYAWREETSNEVYGRFLLEPVDSNMSGRSRPRQPPPLTFNEAAMLR